MKATIELVNGLRLTADRIESGEYEYNWWDAENCVVALLGKTLIDDVIFNRYSDKDISKLVSFGIEESDNITNSNDIKELELLGRYEDGNSSDEDRAFKYDPVSVINYFRNKANELERQLIEV